MHQPFPLHGTQHAVQPTWLRATDPEAAGLLQQLVPVRRPLTQQQQQGRTQVCSWEPDPLLVRNLDSRDGTSVQGGVGCV